MTGSGSRRPPTVGLITPLELAQTGLPASTWRHGYAVCEAFGGSWTPKLFRSRAARSSLTSAGDLTGDDGGVLTHPHEERRLAFAQEVDSDEVEPRGSDACSLHMDREAELVERARAAHPGLVVGPEASGEDHGPEAAQVQLDGRVAVEGRRLGELGERNPSFGHQLSHEAPELRVPLIAPGHALAEVRREAGVAPVGAEEAAEQGDPHRSQRPVVEVVAAP